MTLIKKPEFREEEQYKQKLREEILALKKKRNAIILAHNYQRDEIQEMADITGDSLELSRACTKVKEEVIVFCGVHFMAETAKILNPHKTVLLPVLEAGCPLAEMITIEKLKALKSEYPDAAVVSYVNSPAEIKAESDICCTSSNGIKVVKSLKEKKVIFVPDRNLARWVQLNVPEKELIIYPGFCITHMRVKEEEVLKAKAEHPGAVLLAHPECEPDVLKHADCITSTAGMFSYVKQSPAKEFIIATEKGMLYRLGKENPGKKFYLPSEHLICATMKLTTLGWILHALEFMEYEVTINEDIRQRAIRAITRMLEVK